MTSTLYVAPCRKAKGWDAEPIRGPTPAGEAYTGTFGGAAAKFARASGAPWVILSAKYGFLRPTDLVPGPYNTTFLKPSPDTIQVPDLREQIVALGLGRYSEVVVLGGSTYAKWVKVAFAGSATVVRTRLPAWAALATWSRAWSAPVSSARRCSRPHGSGRAPPTSRTQAARGC